MIKKLIPLIAVIVSLTSGLASANAGERVVVGTKQVVSNWPYEKGAWELQGLVGYYWDLGIYGGGAPLDHPPASPRTGGMRPGPPACGLGGGGRRVPA